MSRKLLSIHEHLSLKKEEFYNNDINLKPMYLEKISLLRIDKRQETNVFKLYDITEEIKEIKLKLCNMKKSENDYYLENFKILEKNYINKRNIEENVNEKVDINNILFKKKYKLIDNNIFQQCHYNKYWINNNIITNENYDNSQYCINCNNEIDDLICKSCSVINKILETTTTYDVNENTRTNYIRLNHMKKIIKQIQGIKTMNISLSIIDKIKERIDNERIDYRNKR